MRDNKNDGVNEAVKLLNRRLLPATENATGVVRRVVSRVLARSDADEDNEHPSIVALLREVLYKLSNHFRSQSSVDRRLVSEMVEMLMAVHYYHMMYLTRAQGLKETSAKCTITLLKYPDYIPQDKAYYLAGMACREQNNINLAFLLLNRFVIS